VEIVAAAIQQDGEINPIADRDGTGGENSARLVGVAGTWAIGATPFPERLCRCLAYVGRK
jgi:hypothetical protein